jgi:hypothetical protein
VVCLQLLVVYYWWGLHLLHQGPNQPSCFLLEPVSSALRPQRFSITDQRNNLRMRPLSFQGGERFQACLSQVAENFWVIAYSHANLCELPHDSPVHVVSLTCFASKPQGCLCMFSGMAPGNFTVNCLLILWLGYKTVIYQAW